MGRYANGALCQTNCFDGTRDHNDMHTVSHRLRLHAITNIPRIVLKAVAVGVWVYLSQISEVRLVAD